ncbi:MAG: hypothetical protein LBC68_08140 [Prevotellaceae bacterium]|jgi:hypothetical protein|nr:hypothetical protein [Prevotellaceae bacterium]
MEQILIHRANGAVVPIQNKQTATTIKSAQQRITLLGGDTVNMTVESPYKQDYFIGDKIIVFGRTYKLNRLPRVNKTGNFLFSYELEFEGIQYDLARATYDLTIDTTNNQLQDVQSDALTGNIKRFADVIIANISRIFPNTWRLGEYPETIEDKTLTFGETDNCLSVLQRLCTEFDTEFEIEQINGVNTIHLRKSGQIFPFTFEFGKGKGIYQLDRQNVSSANIVTRLKVYGATKNISMKYRAQRLCLPNKSKGKSYIENQTAIERYGIWENTKYFEDVYPRRTGTVTMLGDSILKFVDSAMFDLNEKEADGVTTKYLLPGVSAKIHFNTGNLAGYEFEVHAYDHATHTFTLVKLTDDRGDVFPSESSAAFQFSAGDEYKLLDIALPQSYIDTAESELLEKGNEYYDQNSQPKVQYGLAISEDFLKKLVGSGTTGNIINVGDYIPVKDGDIGIDKSIRVSAFTRDLLHEYKYQLTISDTVITSIITQVISDIIDIDKVININNLRDPARARSDWRTGQELLNMIFDPEGNYYSDKISPSAVDTLALWVGAKSMQFGLNGTKFEPNYDGNVNLIKVTGGALTHYTIDENEAKTWNLADNQTVFGDSDKPYYIYAKCDRNSNAGAIIFSTEQIRTEQDTSFYHFWIGIVSSVDVELGVRYVVLSYGFTMINGRWIKTGVISSMDGNTYFDLDGNSFKMGDDTNSIDYNVSQAGALTLKGFLNIIGSAKIAGWIFNNQQIRTQETSLFNGQEVPKILLDGINSIIKLAMYSNAFNEQGDYINSLQTIELNANNGSIRIDGDNNASGTTQLSSQGIIANKAGTNMVSATTGLQYIAAIGGLGYGRLAASAFDNKGARLIGVFGISNNYENTNPAPDFGGYFIKLGCEGLYVQSKQVTSNTTLTEIDTHIACYNSSNITITLPANPYVGMIIFIKRTNTSTVTINGNGNNIIAGSTGVASISIPTRGNTAMLIYDGASWNYNNLGV